MPRHFNPIRPRRKDERAYDRAIRDVLLAPIMRQLRRGLSQAAAAAIALDVIDGVFRGSWRVGGLVEDEVVAHARRLQGYHRRRLIQTFRVALGVDIRPVLSDAAIEPLMTAWRRDNIRLIRTIPSRFHDSLYRRVTETFAERPFDQAALSKVLNREFRSTGYNLRRLTRDQTSKAIGQLTQARHAQLGITEYTWRTAQDERVRDTHAALDGMVQRWDTPPSVGHPGQDIQCRCVADPVMAAVGRPRTAPKATPQQTPGAVTEFVPNKIPEQELGPSYTVETDALIAALGGVDPRTSLGELRIRRWVVSRGQIDGKEHLALVDIVDGSVHAGSSGEVAQVPILGSIRAAFRDPNRQIAAYHNHPGSTALSDSDVVVLGTSRGLERIEAVAHEGRTSVARLTDRIKGSSVHGSARFWRSATDEADHAVEIEFWSRIRTGTMSREVAIKTHQDTRNRVLAEVGVIEYTSTHAPAIGDVANMVSQKLRILVGEVE